MIATERAEDSPVRGSQGGGGVGCDGGSERACGPRLEFVGRNPSTFRERKLKSDFTQDSSPLFSSETPDLSASKKRRTPLPRTSHPGSLLFLDASTKCGDAGHGIARRTSARANDAPNAIALARADEEPATQERKDDRALVRKGTFRAQNSACMRTPMHTH